MDVSDDVKKKIIFLITHYLCLIFVDKDFFFSRKYRDEIINIFHNIWKVFQMTKIKYSNSNF